MSKLVVKRALWVLVALAVLAYAGLCAALYTMQGSMLYLPKPRLVSASESTLRLPVDGAELVVTVRPHAGPKALLYFGGNAEDVSRNLASFDKWFPDHALYLMHYRSYGGSTGTPTERDNHRDAAALFEKVRAQHPDVVVVGRSLGSGVAVRLASEQRVSRLVLVTPYDSIEAIAAGRYPYAPVSLLLRDKYQSDKVAPAITIPTTIIAADQDKVVPRASTDRLLAKFSKGIASMTVIPGTDHSTIIGTDGYRAALQSALLASAPAAP